MYYTILQTVKFKRSCIVLYLKIIKFVGHFNCELLLMVHDNMIKEIVVKTMESKEPQKYKQRKLYDMLICSFYVQLFQTI